MATFRCFVTMRLTVVKKNLKKNLKSVLRVLSVTSLLLFHPVKLVNIPNYRESSFFSFFSAGLFLPKLSFD